MVFITGASSGIGEACARAFAAAGRGVILTARRKTRLEALASELRQRSQVPVQVIPLDVSDRNAISKLEREESTLLSEVTILVNNAGLALGIDPVQTGNLEEWDRVIDTNVKGVLYVTRAILPYFLRRGEGHIVNIGSVAGQWTYPKGNVYCASKAAVHALNEAMRLDLSGTGVRVTEIAPGMVETEFSKVRLKDEGKAAAVYNGMKPLTASDIADAVVWCVSRPAHVNIQEMVIYPTDQASPTVVHRR